MTAASRKFSRPDFYPGRSDGIFGGKTRQAVINFQKAMGLTADGIVGDITNGALQAIAETSDPASVHFYTTVSSPGGAQGGPGSLKTTPFNAAIDWKTIGIIAAVGLAVISFVFKDGEPYNG